jgi:hypothetical protein
MMRIRSLILAVAGALAFHTGAALAQAADSLVGQVTSAQEGAMEGVVVSARKAGSIVTVSVMTDQTGHYRFPTARLEPGSYALAIRAAGYDLDGKATAEVVSAKTATADLKLKPTRNLPAQLSNAEWLASMPGTDGQKKALLNCIGCHDLDRIVRSTHDADEFMQIFDRMAGYYPGSTPENPQRLIGTARRNIGQGARSTGDGRVSRLGRPLQRRHLDLQAADFAAAQGPRHARHRHRVRPAAQDDPAARRRPRRAGSGLVHSLRRAVSRPV